MSKKIIFSLFLLTISLILMSQSKEQKKMEKEFIKSLKDGLYAKINTTDGIIWIKFNDKESPVTVANFIALAEGTKEGMNKPTGTPFYNGTKFHRVIKDFMIQGGDPKGNGTGDAGYKFDDEKNNLSHEKGVISMANSGPNTNGSQFFITHAPTKWLDGNHTIFGNVIKGIEVVDKIGNTQTGRENMPVKDINIESIEIIKLGKAYKKYDGNATFNSEIKKITEKNAQFQKAKEEAAKNALNEKIKGMTTTASGLKYKITKKGTGQKVEKGKNVVVHYTGMLEDGKVFDSSYNRGEPIKFPLGSGMVIPGWEEGIALLHKGDKAVFFIPSKLAYGEKGAGGGIIPPNANLIFEVELVDFN